MDKKLSQAIKITLSVAMAAALLWLSFREVHWGDFAEGMVLCKWHYVILGIGLGAMALWLRGQRWRELLLPIDPETSRLTTFNAVCISYVVNMIVPRGGELLRGGIISRHSSRDHIGYKKASYDKALGTVVVERIWDTVVLITIAAAFVLVAKSTWSGFLEEKLGSVKLPSLQILLVLAIVAAFLLYLCKIWWKTNSIAGRIWRFVTGVFSGVRDSLKMKQWWKFLLYTAFIWLCYWGVSYAIILALADSIPGFAQMNATDALFLMIVGSIASVVPVPGGFGAFHYMTATSLMALYGIPMEQGLVFAVLSHESQTLMQLVCGAGSYISETVRK